MPLAFSEVRAGLTGVCAAVLVVGGLVVGCAQAAPTTQDPTRANAQQQCVRAVFDVLSGMATKPYDSQPFQDFVTRYGTGSVTYSTYLDVFPSFNSLSASQGVHGAVDHLRPTVTRDCATAP
jgi:cytochrome c556